MHQQYYREKGILGTSTQALEWIWYDQMDDIFVGTTKANGVPQGMDMGEDIHPSYSPQEVDGDINSNVDPTLLVIQVPVFGAISKDIPISLQFATCAHKGVGGAPNKKLKTYA
jgi:hypothetical protein